MKYFLIICVLAFFLICANSNSDELNKSENSGTSLETLKAMLLHTNERLSSLEEDLDAAKKQKDKFISNCADMKELIASQSKRIKKIEKLEFFVKLEDISKSFETTVSVLSKNVSDMAKRLENKEVKLAVVEKIYKEDSSHFDTLMKAMEEQKAHIHNMEERLYRREKIPMTIEKSPKKLDISKKPRLYQV
ncbi:MAG: hypothetical protein ACYSR1_00835 [Planctomycetota bacterium]